MIFCLFVCVFCLLACFEVTLSSIQVLLLILSLKMIPGVAQEIIYGPHQSWAAYVQGIHFIYYTISLAQHFMRYYLIFIPGPF